MRRRHAPRRLAGAIPSVVVATTVVLASVAWIVVRAVVPTDGAPILTDPGFERGLTLDPLDTAQAQLHAEDVVIAVNGVSIDGWLRRGRSRPSLQAGALLRYRLVHDGREDERTVTLRHGGLVASRLRDTAGSLMGAAAILVIGAFTVLRRPEHPATRGLLLMGAGLVAYDIFGALSADTAQIVSSPEIFAVALVGTMTCLVLWSAAVAQIALTFPRPIQAMNRRGALPFLYSAALVPTAGALALYLAVGRVTLAGLDRLFTAMAVVLYALIAVTFAGLLRTLVLARRDAVIRRQAVVVAIGFAISGVALFVGNTVAGSTKWPEWFSAVAVLPVPLAVATALLRGEFLDIKATISRGLSYLALTAALIMVYVAVVLALGGIAGRFGIAQTVPATAVIAVAFSPTRVRIQRLVDRLFYGERGEPHRVFTELGRRLEAAVPSDALLPTIVETIAATLRLPYVAVRVEQGEAQRTACERGEPPDAPFSIPLIHRGERVGDLVVGPRRGERSLTSIDERILHEVSPHAAAAVSVATLGMEVVESRSELAVAREEERARLRRDLHDRLGSQLGGVNLQLDALQHRVAADVANDVDKVRTEVHGAIDELRRITRGLRPAALEDLGLVPALTAAAGRFRVADERRRWEARIDAAVQLPPMAAQVEAAAYHIALEAITNAYRHSGGTQVDVRIGVDSASQRLVVSVRDNGSGTIPTDTDGVGLRSMRERAAAVGGSLDVGGGGGAGVLVRALLPLTGIE